jgi:tRNA(Ser,Leu) C12 N-acetylase TAN1
MTPSTFVVTTAPGFEGEARRELRRVLPGAEATNLPMKGNVKLLSPLGRQATLAALRGAQTWCLARVVPVDAKVRLGKDPASLDALHAALPWGERLPAGQTFVIRCRRRGQHAWDSRTLAGRLGLFLEETTGAVAQLVGETDREVAVEVFQDVAYIGVHAPSDRVTKVLRRKRKYAPGTRPLNRAELKLREALDAFGIEPQPGWRALDVGAAPGGWTRVLAERVREVLAVDPAELDPAVAALGNVRHLRCRAEELDPDAIGAVELIVNDMNIDGAASAKAMCALAPVLREGALGIMTVKFPSGRWRGLLREATQRLEPCYEVIAVRRLPHNRNETTLHLRRRGTS